MLVFLYLVSQNFLQCMVSILYTYITIVLMFLLHVINVYMAFVYMAVCVTDMKIGIHIQGMLFLQHDDLLYSLKTTSDMNLTSVVG